jgi:uncharacterized repeat protein (TIGR01451 family)
MPSPVNLDISLETSGETPKIGALVKYTITIKNNTAYPVNNIAVWDTLPVDMVFVSNIIGTTTSQTGNYLFWDLTDYLSGTPFTLTPGQQITIEFTARIVTTDPSRPLLINKVMTDYNDPFYIPSIGKHPPLSSERSMFPIGKPVVFPNPFNLDTNKEVVFDNVVPGSLIQIFTLSGESVTAIYTGIKRATWDGKNRNGRAVSAGIYFYAIRNQSNGDVKAGKLFVVRGN